MFRWIKSLVGAQSSSRNRHVPDPRDRAPLRYPVGDGPAPEPDFGEFDPKVVREALDVMHQQYKRPMVRDIMTLPEMVGEWERMNEAFIDHVHHAQDKYLELQEMRSRIEERLASRNDQIEDEYLRNEQLRHKIGEKRDIPPADVAPATPVVIDNSADTALPVPVADARPSKGNGLDGTSVRLRNPQ